MGLDNQMGRTVASVVVLVMLILTTGGTAFGKINGKKLKDKSVEGSKLADKTITGSTVADDTLTGSQIDESTLGPVPSASALTSAFNTGLVNANVGQTKQLLTLGPFSIEGRCAAGSASIVMTTSVDDANVLAHGGELDNNDFDVNVEEELGYPASEGLHVAFYGNTYSEWLAIAPNGSSIFRGYAYDAKDFLGAPCSFMVVGEQLK
jgi:hypothetical protein